MTVLTELRVLRNLVAGELVDAVDGGDYGSACY